MNKIGDFVCKHKSLIIILCVILLVPALIGMYKTKINYDILVYLPDDIETIKGENILTDDFNMGAFAVTIVDNISDKDIITLEDKIRSIGGVNKVVSINDITGTTIPIEFLPSDIVSKVAKDNSKLILVTFNESTSADNTLDAVEELRELMKDSAKVGGMSAMVLDTKELFNSEMALYVTIAVILCILVLMISLDSYLVPILLILNIGVAILYNMGSNIFLGEISYITKAISAVLQLGVTTDFSIFLYHKYEYAKKNNKDKNKAMSLAIHDTLVSVLGSSLTTIAGFLALCTMKLTLGTDIGIVMAKGVVFGLLCVVTLFPALLLVFDKQIEKTKHKVLLPKFNLIKNFVMKHYKLIFAIFIILLIPTYLAQTKTDVYYKLDESIPEDYGYSIATKALKDDYDIVSQELILVPNSMTDATVNMMVNEIKNLDGISMVLSASSLNEYGIDESMLSDDVKDIYQTDEYKMIIVNSLYEIATDELNNQITEVNDIAKSYDENIIIAGEGPLMKDLVNITDEDFKNVNVSSIAIIFILMLIVLKSISLPVLLVSAIEFAIFINMGIPYFTNTEIPFIASVVIGTIQLGATIDYAILMTTKYLEERKSGRDKMTSVKEALDNSVTSIFVSGMCFFAATVGVSIVSDIDMIGSLCSLISRGAIISMLVVMTIVPSLLIIFDKIITKTTLGFKKKGNENMKNIKKNSKKILASSLVLLMLFNALPVYALSKDETVYSKLDENGKTKYTIVTEHLTNDKKLDKITDSTDLTNIENTNGNEKYTLNNNDLIWEAAKKDIYYKGNTTKQLPVALDVTYKLDGKVLNVSDMLGKEGNVEITLKYKNNDKHGEMYTPFVVAMSTTLDATTTDNLKVTNGKVISNGKSYVVAGLSTPGLYESLNIDKLKGMDTITISYTTTKFELANIYSAVTAKLIDDSDLSKFNELDNLYAKVDTLKSSSDKLYAGSKSVNDGAKKIRAGVISAIEALKNNNDDLDEQTIAGIKQSASAAAVKKVEEQKDEIIEKAMQTVGDTENQTHQIRTASDLGVDNNTELVNTIKSAVIAQVKQICAAGETIYCSEAVEQKAANDKIIETKEKMFQSALELAKQTAGQTAYNTALETAKETANSTSEQVSISVAKEVKNAVINKLVTTLNSLVGGLDSLIEGTENLTNGMEQFNNEGIDKIADFVKNDVKNTTNRIKNLKQLAENYNTFTKLTNDTKSETKFILVIDGQKVKEEKQTSTKEVKNETFFEKFKNLFKKN